VAGASGACWPPATSPSAIETQVVEKSKTEQSGAKMADQAG